MRAGAFTNAPNGQRVLTSDGFGSFQVNYGTTNVVLSNFVAVPEPSTFVLMGLGGTLVLFVGFRRRNSARGGR